MEAPYLSVEDALRWKERAQSQGRISLGSGIKFRYGSPLEPLPHGILRQHLRGRRIVRNNL